jgi:predicted amino acid racemase
MFLDVLKRRNPEFIKTVVELHQKGELKSNSFVIDLDVVRENIKIIKEDSDRHGLDIYWMTKQINRNPEVLKVLSEIKSPKTIAVDIDCARIIVYNGGVVGHIGHLCNVPKNDISWVLDLNPEIITVYSVQKAKDISEIAKKKGKVQDIMLRVVDNDNFFYPGQTGGTYLKDLIADAKEIQKMEGVQLAGITNFPAMLFDGEKKRVVPCNNMRTIFDAVELIKSKTDIKLKQINTPGTTSTEIIKTLAEYGATHIEPGHGMTGTTPISIIKDLPERPGILYLTEVSHIMGRTAYIFGGGMWVDPVFPPYQLMAFVHRDPDSIFTQKVKAKFPPYELIDYYGDLMPEPGQDVRINDSVVFGFRAQIFVTRGLTAVVSGIQEGHPRVLGTYDTGGRKIRN